MARVYATSAEYLTYTGLATAPADINALLGRASRMLDAEVFRLCWYEADAQGMPSVTVVREAFRDATCAQAQWWGELGDSIGAAGVGWGSVQIGAVSLSRPATATAGQDSAARQIASQVWDALRSPDLTPDVFLLGVVVT